MYDSMLKRQIKSTSEFAFDLKWVICPRRVGLINFKSMSRDYEIGSARSAPRGLDKSTSRCERGFEAYDLPPAGRVDQLPMIDVIGYGGK